MRALDRQRYDLYLLTPRPGAFPEAAAALGVKTFTIPYRGTSTLFVPPIWAHFPVVDRLRAFLREHAIQAVMSDYHSLPFIVPAGRPVIWNAMGWWFPIYPWQRQFFRQRVSRIIAITSAVKERLLGMPPVL